MKKANKLNIPRHSSIDHRSSIVLNSNFETVNHSARKTCDYTSESATQNYLSATNLQPRKPDQSGTVLSRLQGPAPGGSTPKNMFLINRRLTKGYLKFLEDKDFIDRRENERHKIEENVKKAMSCENPKVMSKDIQKLISSTILNDPTKRPKSVLKVVDNNCSASQLNSADEIHKQICNRIMGGDFENNLLFVKVQEGTLQNTQHLRERSAPNESSTKSKISSMTSLRRQAAEQVPPTKVKRIHRKSLASSLALSLNNLSDKKRDGEKVVSNTLVEKAKSMNQFVPSSIQIIDATTSLNELEFSQHASSRREGEPVKTAESKTSLGRKLVFENNEGNLKVRMNVKRKSSQSEYSSIASQNKSQKSVPVLKKSAPNSVFVTGNEILASRPNIDSSVNSRVLDNPQKDSITNLNKLCSGIIRSTNKLGAKLKRQQRKIGKDFRRLDTQMERLNYENTIKNWEKSVKQVENIEQKSSFFNLVL